MRIKEANSERREGEGAVGRKRKGEHLWRSLLLFISERPEILFGRWIYLR